MSDPNSQPQTQNQPQTQPQTQAAPPNAATVTATNAPAANPVSAPTQPTQVIAKTTSTPTSTAPATPAPTTPTPTASVAAQPPAQPAENQTGQEPPPNPPKYESESAIKNKTKKSTVIFSIFFFLMASAIIALNIYNRNKLKSVQLNKQQILSTQANDQFLQQASGYVASRQEQLEYILASLPTDSTLITFIQAIENLNDDHAASSTIDFDARKPSGGPGELYIPFKINLSTDPANFAQFLKKLEKLPYIIEVSKIEANLIPGSGDIWQYTLQSKIYVQDNFYSDKTGS